LASSWDWSQAGYLPSIQQCTLRMRIRVRGYRWVDNPMAIAAMQKKVPHR
jgi:hypothetical protein